MANTGFVYALINASFPGLVKVGHTRGAVADRARELSSATGVPTPFVIAYFEEFADSAAAEAAVHALLANKGYRLSETREFFKAPLPEIIAAIQNARTLAPRAIRLRPSSTDSPIPRPAWLEPYALGYSLLTGREGFPIDETAAGRHLALASKLSCPIAFFTLVRHHLRSASGARRAMASAQKAIAAGEPYRWAAAAIATAKAALDITVKRSRSGHEAVQSLAESFELYSTNFDTEHVILDNAWEQLQSLVDDEGVPLTGRKLLLRLPRDRSSVSKDQAQVFLAEARAHLSWTSLYYDPLTLMQQIKRARATISSGSARDR